MTVRYSDREAEITARWEIGTRNLAMPVAWSVMILVLLVIAGKILFHLPIPQWSLFTQMSAAGIAILAASYAERRIDQTMKEIRNRSFVLHRLDDVWMLEERERMLCRFQAKEIQKLWIGKHCVRFQTKYFSICLPLRVCNEFVEAARKNGAKIKEMGWM